MSNNWIDEWSEDEVNALSKWDKKLIECAAKGKWLKSEVENEEDRPVLSTRLIQSLTTGQHNQNWTLHPKGLLIEGFRFTKPLDFDERTTRASLYLSHCTFEQPCDFNDANLKTLSIQKSIFHNQLQLKGTKIEGDLDLSGSHFEDLTQTGQSLYADSLTIHGNAFLRHGFKTKGTIRLVGAHVSGDLDMEAAIIESGKKNSDSLQADQAFIGDSVLLRKEFTSIGGLSFLAATIKGNLLLHKAELSGDISFSNLIIHQHFLFEDITYQADCSIDLCHAHADVLGDDLKSWRGCKQIDLDGFEYNHLYRDTEGKGHLSWLKKMPKGYYPQPYEQLAKNLKADGHLGHARMVLVEKQRQLLKHGQITKLHWLWLRTIGLLIDFGYRPWKVLLPMALILSFGALNFKTDQLTHQIAPAKERVQIELKKKENVGKTLNDILPDYPKFNPAIYSIDTFLPFVDLKQETYWMPKDKSYLWFHIAMGWFLSSLLVAGLAGLVKKDD